MERLNRSIYDWGLSLQVYITGADPAFQWGRGGGGLKFDKKKYCKGVEGPAPGEIFDFQRDVGHCFSLSRLYHQIISKPLNKVMKGLNPPTPTPWIRHCISLSFAKMAQFSIHLGPMTQHIYAVA